MSLVAKEDWLHRDFLNVSGDDEGKAREAFDALCALSRPPALRMLARSGIQESDADDLVQSVFAELWGSRKTLQAVTPGSWYALVRRSLTWQLSKRRQRNDREQLISEQFISERRIPEDEEPYLDELLVATEDRRKLYAAADDLWLGRIDEHVALGVAAAKLILVEGLEKEDVAAMFDVSELTVSRWLREEALLSRAVYSGLYWPVDKLAGYVLSPEHPLTTAELDQLVTGGEPCNLKGWTADEAKIVCWRLRNGLTKREIVRASGGKLDAEAAEEGLQKLHAALPLIEIARSVRQSLSEVGRPQALTNAGIWKRLAFQYAVKDVPNSQIVDLAGPPASVGPFIIDAAKLNRWVTSGLLFSQLASYVQEKRA